MIPEETLILLEELDEYDMTLPPYYDTGCIFGAACIHGLGDGRTEKKLFFQKSAGEKCAVGRP